MADSWLRARAAPARPTGASHSGRPAECRWPAWPATQEPSPTWPGRPTVGPLASGSSDGTVRLWSPAGRLLRVLDPGVPPQSQSAQSSQPLFSLAWSRDGSLLAAGSINFGTTAAPNPPNILPGVVRIWRPAGELVVTLATARTGGKFLNLAWSPDGALLAAGAVDYRIWTRDGTEVARIEPGGTPSWAMAWAPDSRSLAIGDENGNVTLYDTAGGGMASAQHEGGVMFLAYSPDGTQLALGDGDVEIRSAADPSNLVTSMGGAPCCTSVNHAGPVWSPDGLTIAGGINPRVWDPHGVPLDVLAGCQGVPLILAFSLDGSMVAEGSDAGQVCIWRLFG